MMNEDKMSEEQIKEELLHLMKMTKGAKEISLKAKSLAGGNAGDAGMILAIASAGFVRELIDSGRPEQDALDIYLGFIRFTLGLADKGRGLRKQGMN